MNNDINEFDLRVTSDVEIAKAKKDFSRIGFGYFAFSGLALLVSLVIQIAVYSFSEEIYNSHLFLNLLTPVSMYLFALPVLIAVLRPIKPTPPEKNNLKFAELMAYIAIGFGLMYIGAFAGNGVMSYLSGVTGNDYSNVLESVVDGNLWVTAIFVVVIAPIGEELVFRKLLIDRTGKYGGFISAMLSGVIFGLMHGNLYQFFYAALLGLLLGYVYSSTGRLVYCIAIHAVINFFGSIVSTLLSSALGEFLTSGEMTDEQMLGLFVDKLPWLLLMLAFNLLVCASIACAIILPLVFKRKIKLASGDVGLNVREALSAVFFNAGVTCMIVFYFAELMLSIIPA